MNQYPNAGPNMPYTPKALRPALICAVDYPGPVVRTLLEVYYRFMHYEILYVSDKEESERPELCTWMREHHCPPGNLYLGGVSDADWEALATDWDIKFALDTQDFAVKCWSLLGLPCLQVRP